ncbi:MAG: cadherin-like domain-containing protein [Gallionella sp.]|nr:cadherin-like domain-containing protein [Gallionella sp.]
MKTFHLSTLALSIYIALNSVPASAILERVGPVSTVNGYPAWYQDASGLSLEFCSPLNQAELNGGYCLLLPPTPATAPETFPGNFFNEHFYSAATAVMVHQGGAATKLIMALEGGFGSGTVLPGDQAVFARIRVSLNPAPATGTYRFIHPYGEDLVEGVAGNRIFFTNDVGLACGGDFSCAMKGRFGPFLLPSVFPGGPEEPAIAGPVPGKLYVADPIRVGPITGSPLPDFLGSDGLMHNHNVYRIEGPVGSGLGGPGIDFIETSDFSVMGRLFTGQMPGRVTTDRASYARTAAEQKVDVFATAFPTASSRLPTGVRPAGVAPVVSFYDTACLPTVDAAGNVVGVTAPLGTPLETLMNAQNNLRWGQIFPAVGTPLPDSVCVKDNSAVDVLGNSIPAYHQLPVNDEVTISQAAYDAATSTLTVNAASSDQVVAPTLSLAGYGNLVNGTLTMAGITAPPAKVEVFSSARGSNFGNVTTSGAPVIVSVVTAGNDSAATLEDTAVAIPVILGDTLNSAQIDPAITPVTLAIVGNPTKGIAAVNNVTGNIAYSPNLNANGADSLTYTLTANGVTSNIATVSISITPVNDAPIANADTAGGAINTPIVINVLANDTDVDGNVLSIAAGSLTAPVGPAGTTSSVAANANGTVTFTGNGVGVYRFNYNAFDGLAGSVLPAQATVTLSTAETVNANPVEYVASKNRWKVGGSTSIATAHQMTLTFTGVVGGLPCNASGRVIGTTNSVGTTFTFDVPTTAGSPLDPRSTNCNAVRVDSVLGGVDPTTPIGIK